MTERLACANCHHRSHFGIGSADGKRLGEAPCFFVDLSQGDGFCRCQHYRLPSMTSAETFTEAVLGPERHTWEGHDERD